VVDLEPGEDRADVERRPCAKCGCPLAIVTGPSGKKIPLDLRSPVYSLAADLSGHPVAQKAPAFVTHFATCPSASAFGKGRKR
jgi:hypothetical protein